MSASRSPGVAVNNETSENPLLGPYRATRLWNLIISAFKGSMPVGRHRRYMKTYTECFVASDAVFWLHRYLCNNPNFGPEVSRPQTIQLLQKFLKARVLEDVRGADHSTDFGDNGKLYRLCRTSPVKPLRTPIPSKSKSARIFGRMPLAPRNNLINKFSTGQSDSNQPIKMKQDHITPTTCMPEGGLSEVKLVGRKLSQIAIENEYKAAALNSLQKLLRLENLDEILDVSQVSGKTIFHNMTFVTKSGMVTNIDPGEQLPPWVLSAMKCLANWPNKTDENLPNYPGFEKDVFKVVKGYFQSLEEPLLTYDMYEVFTNVLVNAEEIEMESRGFKSERNNASNLPSFTSVENLMMNLTMNAPNSPYRDPTRQQDQRLDKDSHLTSWNISRIDPVDLENNYVLNSDAMYNYNGMTDYCQNGSRSYEGDRRMGQYTDRVSQARVQIPSYKDAAIRNRERDLVSREEGYNRMYGSSTSNSLSSQKFCSVMDVNCDPCHTSKSNLNGCKKFYSVTNVNEIDVQENNIQLQYDRYNKHDSRPAVRNRSALGSRSKVTTTFGTSVTSVFSTHTAEAESESDGVFYGIDHPENSGQSQCSQGGCSSQNMRRDIERERLCGNAISWDGKGYAYNLPSNTGPEMSVPMYPSPPPYGVLYNSNEHRPVINGATRHNTSDSSSRSQHLNLSQANNSNNTKQATYNLTNTDSTNSYQSACSNQTSVTPSYVTACSYNSGMASISASCNNVANKHVPCTNGMGASSNSLAHGTIYSGSHTSMGNTRTTSGLVSNKVRGRSIDSELRRYDSRSSLFSEVAQSVVQDSLQLCCLVLPPEKRRKLHLLMRLMTKMSDNDHLVLDKIIHIRSMVIQTFSRCILCSKEECDLDELLAFRLVTFMMDNCDAILSVPKELNDQVTDRIAQLQRTQVKFCHDDDALPLAYCEQVSMATYENQKLGHSQKALSDLLENIITNPKLSNKDRKKKLKQFQKSYPDLYNQRFPAGHSKVALFPQKRPKIKQPLLQNLAKPLQKLRLLRL